MSLKPALVPPMMLKSNEEVMVPDSLADTDQDPDQTVCYTSDSSTRGKPRASSGGGHHIGGGSGVGTKVMITVHSSPGRIACIADTFQGIK